MESYIPLIEIVNTILGSIVMLWFIWESRNCAITASPVKKMVLLPFTLFLSYCTVNGCVYTLSMSMQQCFNNFLLTTVYLCAIIILTLVYYRLFAVVLVILHNKDFRVSCQSLNKRFSLTTVFGGLMLLRLLYLAIYYPSNIDSDCAGCISVFFSAFTPYSEVLGYTATLSNHNPIIHQILYGGALYVGDLIGSQNFGIFIFVLLQSSLINLAITLIARELYKWGNESVVNIMLTGYALLPVFSLWSIELAKDQLYACTILFYTWQLLCIADSSGEYLKDWKHVVLHIMIVIAVIITKNQGIYVVAVSGLVTTIAYYRMSHRITVSYAVAIGTYFILYQGMLWQALHVVPGGRQEGMGFMYQQSARYAKLYPDEVTEEEKKVIDRLIPYHLLAERYNPTIQDDVKFCSRAFGGEKVPEDAYEDYKRVWLQMGIRRPLVYLESVQNDCFGFFYPFKIYARMFHHSKDPLRICTDYPDVFHYQQLSHTFFLQRGIKYILPLLSALPVAGIFMGFPFYLWMVLFSFVVVLLFRQWKMIAVLMPGLLSIAVLLVSPANDVYRYAEPYVFVAPAAMVLAILIINKNKSIKYEN